MNTTPYELYRTIALIVGIVLFLVCHHLYWSTRKHKRQLHILEFAIPVILIALVIGLFLGSATTGHVSLYYFGKAAGPFEYGPELPLLSSLSFFKQIKRFEQIEDIAFNPADVPPPLNRNYSEHVTLDLEAQEVLAEITKGSTFNYWTFNKRVPGPLLRVRVGDTVTINLKNAMSSLHTHSVDFHAVTGPGGGAKALQVAPGETKSLTWKALNPGLYIYHCASRHSVAAHMAHGQYGLILVEPEEGLPPVDKEFYVVQGELYTRGNTGDRGLVAFDSGAMLDEHPTYIIFNGKVGGLNGKMKATVGDRIRIFVGNGGVAKISSFHIIGEIFDRVYPEAAMGPNSPIFENVQTTIVPSGGATIVEFDVEVPGKNIIVDHGLIRMDKGAWGILEVEGPPNPEVFRPHDS